MRAREIVLECGVMADEYVNVGLLVLPESPQPALCIELNIVVYGSVVHKC